MAKYKKFARFHPYMAIVSSSQTGALNMTLLHDFKTLRIPAIHEVRPDMTHIKSNARLLIISMACNITHGFKAEGVLFTLG